MKTMTALLERYFGCGILLAVILALWVPDWGTALSSLNPILLFLLFFLSGFTIDPAVLLGSTRSLRPVLAATSILSVLMPAFIWLLARLFLPESDLLYGAAFMALTPTAVVVPFFTRLYGGDKELSFLVMLTSTLLAPLVIPTGLSLLVPEVRSVPPLLLFSRIAILVPFPILLSWVITRFVPTITASIRSSLPLMNFLALTILIFIQVSSALRSILTYRIDPTVLLPIFALAFIMDFSLFLLFPVLGRMLRNTRMAQSIVLSAGMKNIAIASTLLLSVYPRAALVPTVAFIAHAFLFTPVLVGPLIRTLERKALQSSGPVV